MKHLIFFLTSCLLCAASADRVTDLTETLRQLTSVGDLPAAGRLAPELIKELTAPHPKAWLAWSQIGVYYATKGNLDEAERAYMRGVKLLEPTRTASGDMALLLLNLSELYLQTGKQTPQAEALARRALKLAEESYEPGSPALANFFNTLGAACQQSGRRKEARMHFEQALVLAGHTIAGKNLRGFILSNLAVLFGENRQWNEARDAAAQALDLVGLNLGTRHPALVPMYYNLATIQREFKQWELASASLEQARLITETQLGPDHRYMVEILESSAFILRKTGRGAEAKKQLRRAKSIAASLPRDTAGASSIHLSDLRAIANK
jgi:tetratricopeptide (TPR) repeat protein